jgi:rSAM/selenodomain-associated transferase 1
MGIDGNALVVLTKAPEPGQSKTRLVPPLSFGDAAELARALLIDQLDHLASFSGAQLFIAFTPKTAAGFFEAYAAQGYSCFLQQGNSLGERMRHAFEHLFDHGLCNVVLIGSDLPTIPVAFFEQAYGWLDGGGTDLVLGPSVDGGYYLIGMNRLLSDVFEGIVWSRDDVLGRTTEKLARLGIKYKLLSLWYDVDTIKDLERLSEQISGHEGMKNTRTLLHRLRGTGRL